MKKLPALLAALVALGAPAIAPAAVVPVPRPTPLEQLGARYTVLYHLIGEHDGGAAGARMVCLTMSPALIARMAGTFAACVRAFHKPSVASYDIGAVRPGATLDSTEVPATVNGYRLVYGLRMEGRYWRIYTLRQLP